MDEFDLKNKINSKMFNHNVETNGDTDNIIKRDKSNESIMHFSKKTGAENPLEHANWLSKLLFIWLVPTLKKGQKDGLGPKDMLNCMPIDDSKLLGDKLEIQWQKELEKTKKTGQKPSLRTVLFKTFGQSLIVDGLITAFGIVLKTLVPVVLAQLLLQYQKQTTNSSSLERNSVLNNGSQAMNISINDSSPVGIEIVDMKPDEGLVIFNNVYWLSFWLVFLSVILCFIHHHVDLHLRMLGAHLRTACCSLIYRKTLKLSKKCAATISTGYVVNLMSNDVCRFDYVLNFIHYIWLLPIQAILVAYFIWQKLNYIGVICVIGLLLQTVPVQTGLGHLLSIYRGKIAKITDQRVGVMNEIIRGIQVIKMYAWEKSFAKLIADIRWYEVKKIRATGYMKAVNTSAMVVTERTTLLIALVCCVLLDRPITPDVVFSLALFFNSLQLTAAHFYPFALAFASETQITIRRIEDYLLMDDKIIENGKNVKNIETTNVEENVVSIKNICASWDIGSPVKTLQGINMNIKRGQLCAIIGPVGAGKVLIMICDSAVQHNKRCSSLLELLIGELPVESGAFHINGNVSYSSQESWLFTGTIRSNILFDEPFNKAKYQEVVKCCALNTDFIQLKNGDRTIVGERGASLSGGQQARINLARAIYKTSSIYLLDDPLSAVDAHVGSHLFNEVIGPNGYLAKQNATRFLVTHQVHFLKKADVIVIIDKGEILRQGTYEELANSDLDFAQILNKEMETKEENVDDDDDLIEEMSAGNGFYHRMTSKRSIARGSTRMSIKSITSDILLDDDAEEKAEGDVKLDVWKKYFRSGGRLPILLLFVLLLIVSQVFITSADYFVNFWTQQEYQRSINQPTIMSTNDYMCIYIGLIVIIILGCFLRTFLFYFICMEASKNLHNNMFSRVLCAPMRFFDVNPSGRILNRFSKDMGTIDELLPKSMMDGIQITFLMIAILVLVIILNPMMIVALLVAVILFVVILKLYMRPAQDIKRLEGIARSPVFTHLAASLSGISTIRARGQQVKLIESFDNIQDVHSGTWRLTMSSIVGFGIWLDLVSSAFIGCVTFGFAVIRETSSSGDVGLAISQAMVLTGMVQFGFRQITESIQYMTSVERIIEYAEIEQEPNPSAKPETDWPLNGEIQMNNVYLRYDINGPPILKNLKINIRPSWKVGIVGRTGAGKSSLINAIFRLSPIEGQILIDLIDTQTISLECLRSKISIIPQDPVLFSASVRDNLDPFHLYGDDDLWRALDDVKLKSSINSLDHMVTESGNNFSVGQRQLVCLARAILRNNRILILDEATANVDPQTDALIQQTIRTKFIDCTVLTIAHRLHTVMDADRILVMDSGTVCEFDCPYLLLQNEIGYLRGMIDATGAQESLLLKQIAADSFKKLKM